MSKKSRRQVRNRRWDIPVAQQPWVHNERVQWRKVSRRAGRALTEMTRSFKRMVNAVNGMSASLSEFIARGVSTAQLFSAARVDREESL